MLVYVDMKRELLVTEIMHFRRFACLQNCNIGANCIFLCSSSTARILRLQLLLSAG